MNTQKASRSWLDFVYLLGMAAVAFVLLSPVIWLVSASFQGPGEIFKVPFRWIPQHISLENYKNAWEVGQVGRALWNSVSVSVLMLVFHLFLNAFSGYVIVKYSFKFKSLMIVFVLATLMLPQEITFLPVYNLVKSFGLVDSHLGLAIPFFYSGFGVFLMMQFARAIPDEILESARIDGCSEYRIFFRIALPLLKSAIAALGIMAFSFIWNEYAWANIVVLSDQMRTLPISLTFLAKSSDNSVKISALIPASVIAMTPVMLLFFIFQRQFVESVASSGVKG
ncbi:carbohydrate ABC transporter permease [Cohnella sp. LGH]|uniref:carbohydrate ABC transporter permease n=1 Tax=Cohnella sp. LGH TaxID=1619153 RepID=UPI001ADCB012|nr:carbohydrate ABC transporter permease [Cohnella sp. LGH]QTH42404.1 carbohydrate ABC transporter permease [Cohnella sp. LGH]